MGPLASLFSLLLWGPAVGLTVAEIYHGVEIGSLSTNYHEVRGEVYAVDKRTLFIEDFNYDGKGTGDVVFWAGTGDKPDDLGFPVHSEKDKEEKLPEIRNEDLVLHLPDGIKITDINWLSVWNKNYSISFGAVKIPETLAPPQPLLIGSLTGSTQYSSGGILVLDSQTFIIPDFSYEKAGKDIQWWLSNSNAPIKGIRVSEELDRGLLEKKNGTLVLSLPDGSSVFDYNFLSLWNGEENVGYVILPENLNVPPSPRALKLKRDDEKENMNCEMLNDNLGLEVRWLITEKDIIIHLVGNLEDSEYMALGLSKDDTETLFDSADAAVTWIDEKGNGHAIDYFFENTEKCENGHGMCPDEIHPGGSNNLQFMSGDRFENITIVTFKRPLKADDQSYDQNIYTDGPQAVLWAVGSVEKDGLIGTPKLRTRGNLLLDFGRDPNWNCPPPKKNHPTQEILPRSESNTLQCKNDHVFRANMGKDINNRKVWFINGIPMPRLTLVRGKEYTFIVEAERDSSVPKSFYITNDKDAREDSDFLLDNDTSDNLFAAVNQAEISGLYLPVSEGKLCEWSDSTINTENSSLLQSTKKLTFACEPGNFTKFNWTPDSKTPEIVYYQSSTFEDMKGVIHIVNNCEDSNFETHSTKSNKTEESLEEISSSNNIKTIYKEDILYEPKKENHVYETKTFENSGKDESVISSDNSNNKKQVPISIETHNTILMNKPTSNFDTLHPHDESERSDKNLEETETKDTDKTQQHIPELRSQTETYSVRPSRFNPHFEGGFIPLVLNPTKEKISTLPHNFQALLRRPYRPFLFNESIPFHGTFKPGVPDFSGFNISHYSNEESVDDISLVASSNPMMSSSAVPLPPLPPSLHHHIGMPQMFGRRRRPPMPHMRFYPALQEMASQRVQITLQSPNNNNIRGMPNMSSMRMPEIKQQEHTPPIQRRPDVYKSEMQLNNPGKLPQNHLPDRPTNLNKNERPRVPPLSSAGAQQNPYQPGIRRPLPGMNRPNRINRVPNNQFLQNPHREALPNLPLKQPLNTQMHGAIPGMQTKLRIHPSLVKPKPTSNEKELDSKNQTNNLPPPFNPAMIHPRLNPAMIPHSQLIPLRQSAMNNPEHFKMKHGPQIFSGIKRNKDDPRNQNLPRTESSIKQEISTTSSESSDLTDENDRNRSTLKLTTNSKKPINEDQSSNNQETDNESEIDSLDSLENIEKDIIDTFASEETSTNTPHSTTNAPDYIEDNLPFGVRLKSPPNGGNQRRQPNIQNRQRSTPFPRKPQLTSSQETKKRPNFFAQFPLPNNPKDNLDPKVHPIDPKPKPEIESIKSVKSSESIETIENIESSKDSQILPENNMQTAFENSTENIHDKKPIFTNSTQLHKHQYFVTYNLTIPQITEKPPNHDNGTDYSILNHVLSLIGNQPERDIRNQNELELKEQSIHVKN